MSPTVETALEVRPFQVDIPEDDLADLRRRIAATRWPEKETVADPVAGRAARDDAGRSRATGATEYDFAQGRGEAERPAAVHDRDRRPRHPLHPRPLAARERAAADHHARLARLDHRDARTSIGPLTDPTAHGGERGGRVRRGDPVDARATGSRASRRRPAGTPSTSRVPGSTLMKRLGYTRYVAQGGDWGAIRSPT